MQYCTPISVRYLTSQKALWAWEAWSGSNKVKIPQSVKLHFLPAVITMLLGFQDTQWVWAYFCSDFEWASYSRARCHTQHPMANLHMKFNATDFDYNWIRLSLSCYISFLRIYCLWPTIWHVPKTCVFFWTDVMWNNLEKHLDKHNITLPLDASVSIDDLINGIQA